MSQTALAAGKPTRLVNPEYRAVMLGKLDRRTWQGRLLRDARAELVAHVGGRPSATQAALIEQLAQLRLRLALYDRKLSEQGDVTDHDRRSYLAFSNSYARLLRLLGLKGAAERPPSLAEHLAELEAEQAARQAQARAAQNAPRAAPLASPEPVRQPPGATRTLPEPTPACTDATVAPAGT